MIRKLRIKFVCINMLIVGCMLLILFGMLYHFMGRSIEQDQLRMLSRLAEEPIHKGSLPTRGGGEEVFLPHFILEYGLDGTLMAHGSDSFELSDEAALEELYDAAITCEEQSGVLKDYGLRYYKAKAPHGLKLIFADATHERATLQHLLHVCLFVGALSFAAFFVLSILLARWAVRPVEEAWRQQKQFVADASHELKTPLTVIMANAELLNQDSCSDGQKRQFSESILLMSRQMRQLLEQLLDLARLDNVHEKALTESVDLSALTEECVLPFEPVYFERGLTLESEIEPGVHVQGSEQQLRQTLNILLDNAQKYSDPGVVRLSLSTQGRHCHICLSNPSAELSRTECRDIFKRFYRRDEAHSRDGSYGLGLPIAESIVTQHDGKISCSWEAGEIRFLITLPISRGNA